MLRGGEGYVRCFRRYFDFLGDGFFGFFVGRICWGLDNFLGRCRGEGGFVIRKIRLFIFIYGIWGSVDGSFF